VVKLAESIRKLAEIIGKFGGIHPKAGGIIGKFGGILPKVGRKKLNFPGIKFLTFRQVRKNRLAITHGKKLK